MCQVKEFGLQAMESVNAAQQSSLQHSLTQVGVVQSRGCCSQHTSIVLAGSSHSPSVAQWVCMSLWYTGTEQVTH